ncbi:MAG: helix-turn-helix domain-containing protein [Candidatus Pacearchaeota archaeon]|jgi:sugar-specific transcriptional regulator TrmB|nr:helix-turn-helix domain-containing protein [Candidatus Pacearchaeota archaeon]|tara:strand:+ start:986 stop:1729 length:744 start_codon:yes stop_codon:yes gene_type:complete
MEEDKVIDVLESIGLNKNEILVYLDLIRIGKSSAGNISKRTKIHRSNMYDILEKLVKKEIIDQITENEKKFFYPKEPRDLLNYLKQKEEELEKIVPEIEKIQNKPKEERKVSITEGLNPVKNIIMQFLDSEKSIDVYGTPKEAEDLLGGFIPEFHKLRIKKKIPMRHIFGIDSLKRVRELNEMEYTEARYFPSSYNSKISTNICCDKIILILWDMPVSAIIIENKQVAETYKNYFEILWESSKVTFK